jgi:hypothetical protein
MPRKLTQLRIDEVSSVDKGAGEGVKIVLMKRDNSVDDPPYLFEDIMKRRKRQSPFAHISLHKADDDISDDDPFNLRAMANVLVTAGRFPDLETATDHLLHNAHGRRLAEHLNNLAKGNTSMTEQVDIFKVNNIDTVVAISKSIIDGKTDVYTTKAKATFDQVLIGHAQQSKRSLESILTDPATPEIREAYALSKGYRPGATD